MRYFKVSTVPLLLLLILALSVPASASKEFDSWAARKSGELDGKWTIAAARQIGAAAESGARRMTATRRSTVTRRSRPAVRASRPAGRGTPNSTGIDGSRFTKRGSQDFLWQSTKERSGYLLPVTGTIANANGLGVAVYPQLAESGDLRGGFRKVRCRASFDNAAVIYLKEETGVVAISVETDLSGFQIGASRALTEQTGTLENNLDGRHVLKSELCGRKDA